MENKNIDKEKIIEEMRTLRDKRQAKIDELNKAGDGKTSKTIIIFELKYLGQIGFKIEGREELVLKDVYLVVEEINGEFQYKYYDEDMQLLGMQMTMDMKVILSEDLVDTKNTEEQKEISKFLEEKDKEKAKTLEELEEEHKDDQKAKENRVSAELSANLGESKDLKITTYRRIVDKVFPEQFPETCSGAQEIGMAYSEKMKAFVLVADYGNGFEIARGTEPAQMIMEQVYDIDKENQTVEKEEPHAIMKMTGNGNPAQTTELSITIGQYGYIEIDTVHRTPDNTRITDNRKILTEGQAPDKGKTLEEYSEEEAEGVDAHQNTADLITGKQNSENEYMKQDIVVSIMQSHEEELESLYGNAQSQEAAIRRYIERAVQNANTNKEDIKKFVEENLETDYGVFFKDRTQH